MFLSFFGKVLEALGVRRLYQIFEFKGETEYMNRSGTGTSLVTLADGVVGYGKELR